MELDAVKSEPIAREFLAVVISGFGNELAPLTGDNGEEPCPKPLLAVANKPLIEYVLNWLEQSGIKDVLFICPTSHRASIHHHVNSDISTSTLRIDIQTYDETPDSNTGTCAILRHFAHRIDEDFVLVPCDFIPPPTLPLSLLLNKFRVDNLSEGSIATACWYTSGPPEKSAFPEEWGLPPSTTPIVMDTRTSTLLHVETPDTVDRNPEELDLKMSLLTRFPNVRISSQFQDSHVYVCRRSVLSLLQQKPYFHSIKEDFFPWLCKLQYQRSTRRKYGALLNSSTNSGSQRLSLNHSTLVYPTTNPADFSIAEDSVPASPIGSDIEIEQDTPFKIGIVTHSVDNGFAIRVNTIQNFYEINRRMLVGVTYTLPSDPKDRSLIDAKAQISSDSMVGDSTQISERTSIKRSIIGRHCVIGKMVKISGCVLLDHCVIEDGAKLDTCILGKNTKIGGKAELSRCITQAGYEVSAGETLKGEKLEVSDWTNEKYLGHDGSDDDSE